MPEGAAIAPSRIATKATEAKTTFQAYVYLSHLVDVL